MRQSYKAVYFPDRDGGRSAGRSLTLAFGEKAHDLFAAIRSLSSEEIRQALGHDTLADLEAGARSEELPTNLYCMRRLRHMIRPADSEAGTLPMGHSIAELGRIAVTFKGGKEAPFHRWYPYIEGYSPDFVDSVIGTYAPSASAALDPFGGTGTTCIVAARRRLTSYCCEVNPVMQFIAQLKFRVCALPRAERLKLAEQLTRTARQLDGCLSAQPDAALLADYYASFGGSRFFDEEVLDQIARIRSWLDDQACTNNLLADALVLAVLAALVPASNMKRAGDLRYKTAAELKTQNRALLPALVNQLEIMAEDIVGYMGLVRDVPLLVAEDARTLARISPLGVDVVVTSPPYVNGTNYFRNTKIELWFLRCLRGQADLAAFRARTVTAGINDVTASRRWSSVCLEVDEVVAQLERSAYDQRIPRMVACYFSDLEQVFAGLRHHLNPGARICVDIGDSIYSGVHVPADSLLCSCLERVNYKLLEEVTLRQRRSRDGSPLKQSLLVFEYTTSSGTGPQATPTTWWSHWHDFKVNLPHQKEPFSSRNWGHPFHSLCSYAGKLKPAIAHHLIKVFVPEGGRVLDPFSGVGTVPFEAGLAGRQSYAFDISPLAVAVSTAKLQRAQWSECKDVIESLRGFIADNRPTEDEIAEAAVLGFNGVIAEYYEPRTLDEILLARRYFRDNRPASPGQHLVFASLLHILHGNRPYALSRRSHPLTPYKPTGIYEYRSLTRSLEDKVCRSLNVELPETFCPGRVYTQDATGWWPADVVDLDAVVTSPPFFDSTRFHLANWLRLWFAGWSKADFAQRPNAFVDERQKESFDIYVPLLRQARERLKPGGVVVLHLGRSKKCDMAAELMALGLRWFSSADILDENVEHCESHGVRDKGAVTSHQYLVLH